MTSYLHALLSIVTRDMSTLPALSRPSTAVNLTLNARFFPRGSFTTGMLISFDDSPFLNVSVPKSYIIICHTTSHTTS